MSNDSSADVTDSSSSSSALQPDLFGTFARFIQNTQPESEEEEDSEEEGSDSDNSISSYSESERPDRTFEPMPEHLTLPNEVQCLILSSENSQFQLLWGTYRFVCKAWKAHIESLAERQWVRTGAFAYRGYMTRDSEENKVFLSGFFTFQRLEGDTAVFADTECVDKYRKSLIKACKATAPPDVQVCGFVHDIEIPDMSVDWPALTITCPWRMFVGRILAEELRVEAYRAQRHKAMMTKVKRMPGDGLEKFQAALKLFGSHVHSSYEAVRKARIGYTDRDGDERLKHARVAAGWRLLDEEREKDEDKDKDEEDSGEEEDIDEEDEGSDGEISD
ncbi:hypothetical protein C8R43DRAFT_407166 [Mycena crocata]|nr:hypothetical protein C8R43DRAFT_407166 [Mycena crocata]